MAELITGVAIALLVVFAILVIAGLILRGRRRHQAREANWQSRALNACAATDALHDRLETRLMLVQSNGEDEQLPADRWSDTDRSMEQLATKLHALRFGAPNYTAGQATQELIMALAALRSTLKVDDGSAAVSPALAGEPVSTPEARLIELDAAVRALRAAI